LLYFLSLSFVTHPADLDTPLFLGLRTCIFFLDINSTSYLTLAVKWWLLPTIFAIVLIAHILPCGGLFIFQAFNLAHISTLLGQLLRYIVLPSPTTKPSAFAQFGVTAHGISLFALFVRFLVSLFLWTAQPILQQEHRRAERSMTCC